MGTSRKNHMSSIKWFPQLVFPRAVKATEPLNHRRELVRVSTVIAQAKRVVRDIPVAQLTESTHELTRRSFAQYHPGSLEDHRRKVAGRDPDRKLSL